MSQATRGREMASQRRTGVVGVWDQPIGRWLLVGGTMMVDEDWRSEWELVLNGSCPSLKDRVEMFNADDVDEKLELGGEEV